RRAPLRRPPAARRVRGVDHGAARRALGRLLRALPLRLPRLRDGRRAAEEACVRGRPRRVRARAPREGERARAADRAPPPRPLAASTQVAGIAAREGALRARRAALRSRRARRPGVAAARDADDRGARPRRSPRAGGVRGRLLPRKDAVADATLAALRA